MGQAKPLSHKLPWNDRAGRLSPLKAAVFALVLVPGLWIAFQALFVGLGPRPFIEAIHQAGEWTIYLLLATLAITPARRLFNLPRLILVRRIVGVAALTYILLHLFLFIADSHFDLFFVGREIALRIYLTIGFAAILALSALGATSTDAMIKRMGAIRWNRLHQLIYPATALGIFHFYMQSKIDVSDPVLMSGFFFWLMGYRIMAHRGYKDGMLPLLLLAIGATATTVLAEAAWYGIATGIGAERVILSNLDFGFTVRPAWWVLIAGVAIAFVSEYRLRAKLDRHSAKSAVAA